MLLFFLASSSDELRVVFGCTRGQGGIDKSISRVVGQEESDHKHTDFKITFDLGPKRPNAPDGCIHIQDNLLTTGKLDPNTLNTALFEWFPFIHKALMDARHYFLNA